MENEVFLEVTDLSFRYFEQSKHNILDHVSFTVETGKTTVFIGPSGCGKSTLAAVCAGLYPENGGILVNSAPGSGQVRLLDRPVDRLSPNERASFLSLLFQNPDLQFCMDTLRNELRFCMENMAVPPEEMDGRIERLSDELGIAPLLDRALHTLSGGEKQKAALCCLFAIGSRGLFLDEPFANIDSGAAKELIRLLRQRKQDSGLTILAIDHRLEQWLELADEFIILGAGGQVVQRGITAENLVKWEPLFTQNGIFFPHETKADESHAPAPALASAAPPAIVLEHLTIARKDAVSRKSNAKTEAKASEHPEHFLLADASATFARGKITAILGPSGAGKTSLFYTLLGRAPYSGSILLDGKELRTIKPRRLYRELGMVFQNPGSQFITQNVLEEVAASLRIWNRDEDPKALLEEFQLSAYANHSPYMLSQGQQRRLAVLSMLAGGQKILLLDEPTYGQDERSTIALMEQLTSRVEQTGLTVIMITHDEELAAEYAHQRYRLTNHRLIPLEAAKSASGAEYGNIERHTGGRFDAEGYNAGRYNSEGRN